MARGDHIYVRRRRHYSHHGIDCGDGSVIHFAGTRGTIMRVARTSAEEFAAGCDVITRDHAWRLGPEETIRNAESLIGTQGYSLVRNNCEHFAAWCCTGRAASSQVRRWFLASQGAVVSLLVATQALGAHLAVLGTLGAGAYAVARPIRRGSGRRTGR